MAKNRKNENGRLSIKRVTLIFCAVSAVFCIGLFALIAKFWQPGMVISTAVCVAAFALLCGLAWFIFERKNRGTTLDDGLASVIGRIMFDAVVKTNTPVFICDSEETVIWYNNATEEVCGKSGKIYGKKASELVGKDLSEIRSDRSRRGAKLTFGGRVFYASYDHINTDADDFTLITTTDATDEEALIKKMADDEPVVSYIVIDNFMEMMQYDSEIYRPVTSRIDEILRDWTDEVGGILKEYERDKYLFIADTKTLNNIIQNKFDILDRVREIKVAESNIPMTISMGVSAIKGSFEDKEKAARAALDMALQRGGDQAAVKNDESIDFYGGVTKTVQKRTNVKARVVAGELVSLIKKASNVIVMGHKYADFDAFGACIGLARIAMHCGSRVNVVVDESNRSLIDSREIIDGEEDFRGVFVDKSVGQDLLQTGTFVIVTDLNDLNMAEAPDIAFNAGTLAVIDHHIKKFEFEKAPDIEYIDPSASSACELVSEMLEQILPNDALTYSEANLMLSGITLDTKQFTRNTGTRTFSAAMYLRDRGADPVVVTSLFRESFDDYKREANFRGNVEIYRRNFAITDVGENIETDATYRIIAAKAADNLLKVEGIQASFAVVKLGDTVHISARSTGAVNVQLIMESMGGGGHFDGAAVQLQDKSLAEAIGDLKQAIDTFLSEKSNQIN
ncbi:MAG: DHH family phosphoesterase [Clostridia bacterium]|nr:DHH family phosphoesterase [Clostridia bacterium]